MELKRSYLMFLLCIAFAVSLRAASIGAVVQTWHYDPTHNPPLVTVKIVNNSHKEITAFNIAIKETYADGRVEQHEVLKDLSSKIIQGKEFQGDHSRGAENFRKVYGGQYGDGAWHPGEVRDEELPVQPGLTDYQAVIDVVTYIDGTAESTNDDALQRIIDGNQAWISTVKIAIETIETALAEPNDTDPSMTAAKKLQDRVTTWNAQQHTKIDLETGKLEATADELKSLSSNVNKRDALKQIVSREEKRLSAIHCHGNTRKDWRPAMRHFLWFVSFAILLAPTTKFFATCALTVGILESLAVPVPDKSGYRTSPVPGLHFSGNRCRLRRSTQHQREVYSPASDLCLFTRWPFSPFPNASVSSTRAWPPASQAKPFSATLQTAAQPSPGSPETASA